MFALHASEVVREDIDKVLSLKPRFLVHMVKAEEYDLERVAAEGVPVVACPRANALFGLRPRIDLMRGFGVEVALGSDNAMLQPPVMLPVVQSAWEAVRGSGMAPLDILDLAIGGARKILNLPERIPFSPGEPADFFVVGNPHMYSAADPLAELVRRGGAASVVLSSAGGNIWRRGR
jgi:cytosine/adenosine deaminase-related metal-dependent hydrolase